MKIEENSFNLSLSEKGFTLVELLVVVSIVALLASIAIPGYTEYRDSAYITTSRVMAKTMVVDVENYMISETFTPNIRAERANLNGTISNTGSYDVLMPATRVGPNTQAFVETYSCPDPNEPSLWFQTTHWNSDERIVFWKGCTSIAGILRKTSKGRGGWW